MKHKFACLGFSLPFLIIQAPLTTYDCRKFFSRKRITISPHDFCVWDETGDDCAGDIATALFTIHNGRYILVGLKSYAETDDEVSEMMVKIEFRVEFLN